MYKLLYAIALLFCVRGEDGYTLYPSLARVAFWIILIRTVVDPNLFTGYWLALQTALLGYIFAGKVIPPKGPCK